MKNAIVNGTNKPLLKNHTLLVIDMETALSDRGRPSPPRPFRDLKPLRSLISTAAKLEIPTFFFFLKESHVVMPALVLAAGQKSRIIKKNGFSAFWDTDLKDTLLDAGASTLIISGFNSSQCVRLTARSARKEGFDIISAQEVLYTNTPDAPYAASLLHFFKHNIPVPDSCEEYYQLECARFFSSAHELETELRARAAKQSAFWPYGCK